MVSSVVLTVFTGARGALDEVYKTMRAEMSVVLGESAEAESDEESVRISFIKARFDCRACRQKDTITPERERDS